MLEYLRHAYAMRRLTTKNLVGSIASTNAANIFSVRMSKGSSVESQLTPYATLSIVLPDMLYSQLLIDNKGSNMYSQKDMLYPVLGGLNKIIEEAVPRFLEETLETHILLLIYYMYKKTSMAAPVDKLDHCTY
jgi:hypothetical protein